MTVMKKKRSIPWVSTALGCALVLGCSLVLPGCGGGGGGSTPSSPSTPRPPVRNVILQSTFTGLEPYDQSETVWIDPFTTGVSGDLDLTVDWTFASNDVDIGLVRGTEEQALSDACQQDTPECPLELVAQSLTLNKPETLTIFGLPAGSYLVVVVNFGTTAESGVIVVGLTTTTSVAPVPSVGFLGSGMASAFGAEGSR